MSTLLVIDDGARERLLTPTLAPLDLLGQSRPIVRHHHERWDGKGYPDRLAGTAIPLGARIAALADAAARSAPERT